MNRTQKRKQKGGYSYERGGEGDEATENKVLIGGVFADWCGHCKNMHPGFKKLTKKLKEQHGGKLEVMEFSDKNDIDEINQKISKYSGGEKLERIEGFPTTFAISGGKIELYRGETNFAHNNEKATSDFTSWVQKHLHQNGGGRRKQHKNQKGGCSGCSVQHGGYDFTRAERAKKTVSRAKVSKAKASRTKKSRHRKKSATWGGWGGWF